MMRPQPRAFICGARRRVSAMTELRLISSTSSQFSSVIASMASGSIGAGVVDENVDAPGQLERLLGQSGHVLAPAHVGDDEGTSAVQPLEDVVEGGPQLVLVAAGNDDVGPGLGQAARHRLAEALAAAGDQGRLAGQIKPIRRH